MIRRVFLLTVVMFLPLVSGDTFLEDFEDYIIEGFEPETTPDQDWFDYTESSSVGLVSDDSPSINGAQWMKFVGDTNTTDSSNRIGNFELEVPITLTETTFYVKGVNIGNNSVGSRQYVSVDSSAPVRTMVQFFVFCDDSLNDDGCELRVKFNAVDTTGQVLINASQNITQFKIRIVPNWLEGEYDLFVNDVDDGTFPFLEIPDDIGRLRIAQFRPDVPLNMSFDDWQVVGAENGTGDAVEGDAATGLKNFATDIRFTTSGSLFFLGLIFFLILCASVITPLLALGLDNTLIPAISFFSILAALWVIYMEWWPDWVGIGLIIAVAALVGTVTRKLFLGISDASQGPGLVAGSLGYFIIASALLAFSGYVTETISVPSAPVDQTADSSGLLPADQSFLEQVTECIFTGGVFTFGLRGDCAQDSQTTTWKKITDIFGWARAGLNFLFQLLTFQLPIPVIFNVMIVLPPAAALATFAIQIVRGVTN